VVRGLARELESNGERFLSTHHPSLIHSSSNGALVVVDSFWSITC